jgi:hypothetical protein
MDATRLENVTTSYDSATAANGVTLRARHRAILRPFGSNVVGKTTTARMITDPPAGAGDTEATIVRTRPRKRRHNGTDYDRDAPQWLLHRPIHPPRVRSRAGVQYNLPERQQPQHARMANCVRSSNPTAIVCRIEFTSVARRGNGLEAAPNLTQMRKKPRRLLYSRLNTSLGCGFSNGRCMKSLLTG